MNYNEFCAILNKHIFEGEKKGLLKKIAERPERFIGLFRPTKPKAKLIQNILQSHEIRFGDAMEELIEVILKELGYSILPKNIQSTEGENLSLDQYFTDGRRHYFIEQKVRDDHDSTKKRGQINNFKKKLEVLYNLHGDELVGIMYFIDPDLSKNKNFYAQELENLKDRYGVDLYLFYGKELFDHLNSPQMWDNIVNWLRKWKNDLPEFSDINFDSDPFSSFEEVKMLEMRYWRKIIQNKALWDEGIIKVLFRDGATLKLLLNYFEKGNTKLSAELANLLAKNLERYY